MVAHRRNFVAFLALLLAIGCGKSNPAIPRSAPSSASKEWKMFEFPGGGFHVEAPGEPKIDKNSGGEGSTVYRSEGEGFDVGILLYDMTDETPEKAIESYASSAPINFPGATSKPVTHEGLPGIDVKYPPFQAGGVSFSRYLFLNGKEVVLQFNLPKGADENATASQRDRFFNSLKIKK